MTQAGTTKPWWRQPRLVPLAVLGALVVVAFVAFLLLLFHGVVATAVAAVRTGSAGEPNPTDPWALGITLSFSVGSAAALSLANRAERSRRREVARWADAHGWSTDVKRSTLSGRWDSPPFGRAAGQVVRDALRRSDGRGTVFSFTYRSRHVVMTERAMLGPGLRLTPEGPGERIAQVLGGQDITVEWAAFNDRWRIESSQPRYAHAVLHQRMMERLMEPDAEGVSVLVEGPDVVVHAPGRADLGRVEASARLVLDLAALLPRFVVDDHPPVAVGTRREAKSLRAVRWRG